MISIGLVCKTVPKWKQCISLQKTRNARAEQNRTKQGTIKELEIKQNRFRNEPEFAVRTGREAGMASEGEIIYKFKDPNGTIQK
jgi:hypothetical protein